MYRLLDRAEPVAVEHPRGRGWSGTGPVSAGADAVTTASAPATTTPEMHPLTTRAIRGDFM